MARPARRRIRQGPAPSTLVLDSDGLSKAAAGDPRARAWVARARELNLPIVINAVALTETMCGGPRDALVRLLTNNARIDIVDADIAAAAGALLGRANRSDTVDALVAITAMRLGRPVVVLTSDPSDLQALTGEAPAVTVVAV